jgi:hypothetical protein
MCRRDILIPILVVSLFTIPLESFAAFGLRFAPGWANGWPLVPIHVVWPMGMSLLAFVIFETAALGLMAFLALVMQESMPWSARAFRIWITGAVVIGGMVVMTLFFELHSTALDLWPHGYNP